MSHLRQTYQLIENAEQQIKRGNLNESLKYYRQSVNEINKVILRLNSEHPDEVNDEVIESIEILKRDVSQTMFDLENFIKAQRAVSKGSTVKNSINMNMMGSMLLSIKPSMNNVNRPSPTSEQSGDGEGNNFVSDPILTGILNKLQTNLFALTADTKGVGVDGRGTKNANLEVSHHIEQFKRELSWYEQKKFSEYDSRLERTRKENRKLLQEVEKLKDRWNNLVESAKQRRNRE
ncbi:Atg38p KNAG_0B02700 [Huiozyma naganishii CBS 8797]|uniref:Uncharacterized protein n=1 Tax=Huiozyma naganishii (strain ATCC MYA-139 / BCRC 22969 / CBS 8797 / KCTC 17520 / NBRC 10181 / NCYC 3082 / Yp74L-3) TaxID=1071383 RepID=J7RGP5_HUIN7|nr:hypothetical protein KNAG_0B02700 [Kazachstania naganishii CBS 8797]CCK68713.1 hypothetical protein KNAG_0B02700 [Kazachstania naganishii CBS 8797]